jgi:hypothetical protein
MRRPWTLTRSLLVGGVLNAALAIATLMLFLAFEHQVAGAAPDYRAAPVGGLDYEAMSGRPLDPKNPVDRQIIAGLPAADRKPKPGQILFGAFISVTNTSSRPLTTADHIELRHDAGTLEQPLALPRSNPYAYAPRVVRPHARIPVLGSTADDNLAAGGLLLVFRVPARAYNDSGTFELVIHDAQHPDQTTSLII